MILFEIPRRASHCSLCQSPFCAEMEYLSYLKKRGSRLEELERMDFCLPCSEKKESEGSFIQWKSKVPAVKVEKKVPLTRDLRALSIFRSVQASDPESFILALYLAKNKILQKKQEFINSENEQMILYEFPETEELFQVKKWKISLLPVIELQKSIAQKLAYAAG